MAAKVKVTEWTINGVSGSGGDLNDIAVHIDESGDILILQDDDRIRFSPGDIDALVRALQLAGSAASEGVV